MAEHDEAPAQSRHKIDITVGGHTVIVDSDGELSEVEATVKRLFNWSAGFAKVSVSGFSVPPPHVERSVEDLG